jgi:hypothetical protein
VVHVELSLVGLHVSILGIIRSAYKMFYVY